MTEQELNKEFDKKVIEQEREFLKEQKEKQEEDRERTDVRLTPLLIRLVTWIVRIAVGGVFLFSGFVKSIDPWGTLYKFNEYFAVLGLPVWPNLVLFSVFALCIAEFMIGFWLVTGSFRRVNPWFAGIFMLIMLPLTLWLAYAEPIDDCGCFGDALKISNWATFGKNLALSVGILWLIFFNRKTGWLIRPAFQWLGVVVSGLYISIIALLGYNYQPLIDFRPFKIGTDIIYDSSEEEPEFTFIYEKDGKRAEFGENDELPSEDDGWKFVDRIERYPEPTDELGLKSKLADGADFRIWDDEGDDVTEEVFDRKGDMIVILIPELTEMSAAYIWKFNSLYRWGLETDTEMIAVVNGTPKELAEWKDIAMAEYPVYTADDTAIKMLARGNPAVVWLHDAMIVWKGSLAMIDGDRLDPADSDTYTSPDDFTVDNGRLLRNMTVIYLLVTAFIIFISFFPKLLQKQLTRPKDLLKHK